MRTPRKKFPIGVEDFKEIRTNDFYYADKTGLIRDLLFDWGEVNLFTRPRRFGKTLNMSMLRYFFEPGGDKSIFSGLEIMKEPELCKKYMGRFPVVSVSLKSISASDYETARKIAAMTIAEEARRLRFLSDSPRLTEEEKQEYRSLNRNMEEAVLFGSLRTLSKLLARHYDSPVILLIDEYDVPLAKAFEMGYYDQMVLLIRNLFEQALKTNSALKFAVLTGCMRISKESIFTGLNNLRVLSVSDARYDEYFGLTDQEVRELLESCGLSGCYEKIRDWYDGYQFGSTGIYCPWDVINCCDYLLSNGTDKHPQNYWINTSSNDIVRRFIQKANTQSLRREIEALVAGETVRKTIHPELTYRDMYASVENIWSVLYTTGYLTSRGHADGDTLALAIPNMEIRSIFTSQIMKFFKENAEKDGEALQAFCTALQEGDSGEVERCFSEYLKNTISIRDTFVQKQLKENFYHGILLGILGFKSSWDVYSNRESGEGYSDIVAEIPDEQLGIVIEVKYSGDGNLERDCQAALAQIDGKHYAEQFYDDEIRTVLKYGIACYKKRCRAVSAREQLR